MVVRKNNQYSQKINSTLDLHQARLNIKYGAFFDVDKVIHDFSFGLGFELRSDNNSVLDKYSNHTPQITDNNLFSSIHNDTIGRVNSLLAEGEIK